MRRVFSKKRRNILGGVYKISSDLRINDRIRAREVRLISSEGEQIGVVPISQALRTAEEKELDLVEVAPQAKPPVCKIMDYGKYKYEQAKQAKKAKKNQNVMNVKEVQLGVKIEDHDFNVKLKMARRFLNDKDKVKVRIKFRGREMMHQQIGYALAERLIEGTKDIGKVESKPHMEGRNMFMFLAPKMDDNK
ncbi:MAG: translation initiation factor IF-3 [Bacillota bacterium]